MSKFKPCPFCGSTTPEPTSKAIFYECEAKYGNAMIALECKCGVNLHDYTFDKIDYEERLKILTDKWNARYEAPEGGAV